MEIVAWGFKNKNTGKLLTNQDAVFSDGFPTDPFLFSTRKSARREKEFFYSDHKVVKIRVSFSEV